VAVLSSCLLFEPRGARELYVAPGREETLKQGAWTLGSITLEKLAGSTSLESEARGILRLILARDFQPEGGAGPVLRLDASVREREFLRDYRSLNAVSVELRLYESGSEEPLAMALYSENTRETIESHAYLYDLMRRALGLFQR
ncbi:MAG: hypothetical protein JW820_12695, partial [Spirochaetales bacterium]|nr:hypothetical protein [Spirochaetales bacterium]